MSAAPGSIPPPPNYPPNVPAAGAPDWVEDILAKRAATAGPQPEPEPAAPPVWLQPQPGYYPTPTPPEWLTTAPEQARTALSPKTRSALYNATAAGAGWVLGLEPLIGRALASCGAEAGLGPALIVGCSTCLLTAHLWDRRTRHWWGGLAWAARIPLASAITALALYTPASQL